MGKRRNNFFNYLSLIKYATIACVIVLVVWGIGSLILGVPMFELFHMENKMERTATVLRSTQRLNQWVFLTVEDQEVVHRKHIIEDVVKIYSASYGLGVRLKDNNKWLNIQEIDGKKIANIVLPQIEILYDNAIDESKIFNVYGEASDDEHEEMLQEADSIMRVRALSDDNVSQAKANAENHFINLLTILGCDSVDVKWE